jgi:hypothetical protein
MDKGCKVKNYSIVQLSVLKEGWIGMGNLFSSGEGEGLKLIVPEEISWQIFYSLCIREQKLAN